MQRAAEHGNLSSLSVPLAIDEDEQVLGALNSYARRPDAFDQDSLTAATRLAPYAAIAVGNMHAYQTAKNRAESLQAMLESRAAIDQAKDILMARHKLTADQAFQLLTRASMKVHTKVRKVADHLIHTGELPHRRTSTPVNPTAPRNAQILKGLFIG